MSSEANKAAVRQYIEAFNVGDWKAMRQLFAKDALIYDVLGWGKLPDILPIWVKLHEGLAIKLEITDLVAEGDSVAVHLIERGTSTAPFFEYGPTGKSYETMAMEWFEVRDGQIQRRWGVRDSNGIYKQLGFI